MKLRIRNNSLRLRLTQSEVAQFGENGYVEEVIEFGAVPASHLTYALIALPENDIAAKFEDGKITISIPSPQARQWVDSDQVGIETDQDIGDGNKLRILVEKDFACAAPRHGEDDSDAFPNPNLPVC
ncbi:MAG TPA: hypothetical protein VGO50_08775 [Pyrinomonadaceae bacterium]|jgi:hypothetical protein|nr:hypothetical protein [Pyrinomonadaceae bacterium]